MRSALSVALLPIVSLLFGCGGASFTPQEAAGPETVTGTYEAYLAANPRASYPLLALDGKVTCYGGKAVRNPGTNELAIELYIRHALADDGTLVEDQVTFAMGEPMRSVTKFARPSGPEPIAEGRTDDVDGLSGNVSEVNKHFTGFYVRAVDVSTLGFETELDNHTCRDLTLEETKDGKLTINTVGDTPEKSQRFGLGMPTSVGNFTEILKVVGAFQDNVTSVVKARTEARDFEKGLPEDFSVRLQASLPEMTPERCTEVCSHFPPAKRLW